MQSYTSSSFAPASISQSGSGTLVSTDLSGAASSTSSQSSLNLHPLIDQQSSGLGNNSAPVSQVQQNVSQQLQLPNEKLQQFPLAQQHNVTPDLDLSVGSNVLPQSTLAGGAGPLKSKRAPNRKRAKRAKKSDNDDDDSDGFTFEGVETKSGRKIHKPQQFDPLTAPGADGKRRSQFFRRDLQICKVCMRGHSPDSNLIVFCDGCNDPYHQLCHDPPIDRSFIDVPEAQWFCGNCLDKRNSKSVSPLETGLTGAGLTLDDKKTYLSSLQVGQLVELLLLAEKQHPDIKIFSPNTKKLATQARKSKGASMAGIPANEIGNKRGRGRGRSDSVKPPVARAIFDDTTPLPGAGAQIPAASELEISYLCDDNPYIFSHIVYSVDILPPPHMPSSSLQSHIHPVNSAINRANNHDVHQLPTHNQLPIPDSLHTGLAPQFNGFIDSTHDIPSTLDMPQQPQHQHQQRGFSHSSHHPSLIPPSFSQHNGDGSGLVLSANPL
ncbi:uncharacterized protein V1516DRAFT_492074 [Lipomyces oligophaga]|uniref:uncharacterized protein n=1 Tax=Lipomyces oligophaga TaxID=45792 RepID=UPI0034CDCF39